MRNIKIIGYGNYLPKNIVEFDTEFQLTNTLANPYKIRKKAIFKNCKNHQK